MYLRCCCSVCYCTADVAAAVRHRWPDGKICCCGSIHLIPVFSHPFQRQRTLNVRTPWQYRRICSLDYLYQIIRITIFGCCGRARSQGGRQPAEANPPGKCVYRYIGHVISAIEKSGLHQDLSRKRSRSRCGPSLGALIAGRASPCSPLPTLQVPAETVYA